jgi:hypothetical protein
MAKKATKKVVDPPVGDKPVVNKPVVNEPVQPLFTPKERQARRREIMYKKGVKAQEERKAYYNKADESESVKRGESDKSLRQQMETLGIDVDKGISKTERAPLRHLYTTAMLQAMAKKNGTYKDKFIDDPGGDTRRLGIHAMSLGGKLRIIAMPKRKGMFRKLLGKILRGVKSTLKASDKTPLVPLKEEIRSDGLRRFVKDKNYGKPSKKKS